MDLTMQWNRYWAGHELVTQLNPAQEYRRQLIFSRLQLPAGGRGCRLIDFGSGQGDFASQVVARYPEIAIAGLELSQSGVEISRRKVPQGDFHSADLLTDDIPEKLLGWATHAVSSELLEHVSEPQKVLHNINRCLTKDGRLVLTVPGGPMSPFDRHIGHLRHFNRKMLRELLEGSGFEIVSLTAAGFPFFNLYKLAVIASGKRVIELGKELAEGKPSFLARATMRFFSWVFPLNVSSIPLGWQWVAVARRKG